MKLETPSKTVKIIGLTASVITVGAFVTGTSSLEDLTRLFWGEPQVENDSPELPAENPIQPGHQTSRFESPEVEKYGSLEEVPALFHPQTGEALVSLCGDPNGEYELYPASVTIGPKTGRPCYALTPDLHDTLQSASAKLAKQELAAQRQQAQREAALERQRSESAFRALYTNEAIVDTLPRDFPFILLAIDEPSLESRIATALRLRGRTVHTGVFDDAIFSDPVYAQFAAGDPELLGRLKLSGLPGSLLLGRFRITPARATGFGNTVKRNAQLAASIVPLSQGSVVSLPPLAETGAAFDEIEAQAAAEERLVETLLERSEILRLAS